jgi:hypothetical protein
LSTVASKRATLILAAVGCAGGAFFLNHLGLEALSRWLETRRDCYLWAQDGARQIVTPTYYPTDGQNRIMLCGSSEAREAFLPDILDDRLPGFRAFQNSYPSSTLTDQLILLEYVERVYGPSAMPKAVVMGITTRFIANLRQEGTFPLFTGINRYSPFLKVEQTKGVPKLVPKTAWESLRSRTAYLLHQTLRYRSALTGARWAVLVWMRPELVSDRRLKTGLSHARYIYDEPADQAIIKRLLLYAVNFWAVHSWEVSLDRERIRREISELLSILRRHNIHLYVVNMPELSHNRALYKPGVYGAYLETVREAFGQTPFLDLRLSIPDQEFNDTTHTTLAGSIKVSERVAEFIKSHHYGVDGGRVH